MVYSALAVGLMAEGTFFVPLCAQDKAVQVMSLTTLYDLADQQSQKVRVSEAALRAANEGVAAAKSALLSCCQEVFRPMGPLITLYQA